MSANYGFVEISTFAKHAGKPMAIPENVRKNWIEIQKKFEFPVNAIGVKIDAKDSKTLQVWKSEGIDQYQKN